MRFLSFVAPILALVVSQVASAPIAQLNPGSSILLPGISQVLPPHHSNPLARSEPPIHVGRLVYRRDGWLPLEARSNGGSMQSQKAVQSTLAKRESLGEKIRNAFRNVGNKIKQGFQKFGQKVRQGFNKVKEAFHHVGGKIKQAFQHVGNKIKQGFNKVKQAFHHVGNKIKQGFNKVKQAFHHVGNKIKQGFNKVKQAFHHVGNKIKAGLVKAGHWIKENAAKVGKFALKTIAAAASVAGRVLSFVPVIGKAAGKALQYAAKGISYGADKIKANLGSKLEKGMKVMNAIVNPGSAIAGAIKGKAGKALGAVMEALTKREIDAKHLAERGSWAGAKLFMREYA